MNTTTNGLPTPMSHSQNKQDVVKDVQAAPDCLLFRRSPDELATHEQGVDDADSHRRLGARLGCCLAATLLTHPWVSAFTVEPFALKFPDGEKRFFPTYVDPDSIEYVAGAPTPSALEMARGGRGYARGSRLIEEAVGAINLRLASTRFGIDVFHVSRAEVAHLLAAQQPISGWDIFAALCPKQASAIEAQRASAVKRVRVVVETFSTNDEGGSPKFASFVVDRQFLANVCRLRDVCKEHRLTQAHVHGHPDWGPGRVADEIGIQDANLVVTELDNVFYTALPEHHDRIECRALTLEELQAAFDQAADGETIFPGASDDLRQTYEDALAEQGDPGANTRDRGPTG